MLPAARRTRWCPWLGQRTARAPLLACMVARRCCSPWPGHSGGAERSRSTVGACSNRHEPNALKNRRNKARKGGFRYGGALRRGRANSGELLRLRGGLSPRSSVRRGLPRRWRTQRWPWRGEWPVETAGGERRSFGQQWRRGGADWERLRVKEGAIERMGAPGGVDRRPDGVMLVGAGWLRPRLQYTADTWPAPRRRAGASAHGEVGEKLGRVLTVLKYQI